MKLQLDKSRRITAGIVAAAALAAVVLTWLALRPAPTSLAHNAHLTPNTAMRAVFCPARVQPYVSRLAPGVLKAVPGIPRLSSAQPRTGRLDWIHYLPHEMTFLFSQDQPDDVTLTLFVRENIDGPDFARIVNDSPFFHYLFPLRWTPPRLRADGAGLAARGAQPLPDSVRTAAGDIWPAFQPPATRAPSGTHLLEITADNCNGVLLEVHGAIDRAHPASSGVGALAPLLDAWPGVERLHVTADLVGDDRLDMRLEFILRPDLAPDRRHTVESLIEDAAAAMSGHLRAAHGFLLEWTVSAGGRQLECACRLTGFEGPLRAALNPRFRH
jgi:hypothetical protein